MLKSVSVTVYHLHSHQKGPTHRKNFREWEQSKKGSATLFFKRVLTGNLAVIVLPPTNNQFNIL